MSASFPRNRRQRVEWLKLNLGPQFIHGFEFKSDREVKRIFEQMYAGVASGRARLFDPGEIAEELLL